ncbi:MAG: hypothetical protein GY722_05955 [bacterium]|nr:hypothetical protein [bacterium]
MNHRDDDRLVDHLRDALGYSESVDPDTLEMIMTGYDIAGIEVVVADLVYDSHRSENLVPVRGNDLARVFTAEGGGVTFEFEITDGSSLVCGRVLPAVAATVYLDQIGNMRSVALGETAAFEFGVNADAPFRLRLVTEAGDVVATEWVASD